MQATRDEVQELLRMQAEINSRLAAMGVNREQPRAVKAPDGAATSSAHTFLKPVMLSTRTVRFRSGPSKGEEAIISATDFDPDLHETVGEVRVRRQLSKDDEDEAPTKKLEVSTHTHEELLTMTVPVLKQLPEIASLPPDTVPDKKAELVKIILKIRAQAAKVA